VARHLTLYTLRLKEKGNKITFHFNKYLVESIHNQFECICNPMSSTNNKPFNNH